MAEGHFRGGCGGEVKDMMGPRQAVDRRFWGVFSKELAMGWRESAKRGGAGTMFVVIPVTLEGAPDAGSSKDWKRSEAGMCGSLREFR